MASSAKIKYINDYGQSKEENADVVVPIGGDGFLLKSLHDFKQLNKPFYGINYGSVGFLMNEEKKITFFLDKGSKNCYNI